MSDSLGLRSFRTPLRLSVERWQDVLPISLVAVCAASAVAWVVRVPLPNWSKMLVRGPTASGEEPVSWQVACLSTSSKQTGCLLGSYLGGHCCARSPVFLPPLVSDCVRCPGWEATLQDRFGLVLHREQFCSGRRVLSILVVFSYRFPGSCVREHTRIQAIHMIRPCSSGGEAREPSLLTSSTVIVLRTSLIGVSLCDLSPLSMFEIPLLKLACILCSMLSIRCCDVCDAGIELLPARLVASFAGSMFAVDSMSSAAGWRLMSWSILMWNLGW